MVRFAVYCFPEQLYRRLPSFQARRQVPRIDLPVLHATNNAAVPPKVQWVARRSILSESRITLRFDELQKHMNFRSPGLIFHRSACGATTTYSGVDAKGGPASERSVSTMRVRGTRRLAKVRRWT